MLTFLAGMACGVLLMMIAASWIIHRADKPSEPPRSAP